MRRKTLDRNFFIRYNVLVFIINPAVTLKEVGGCPRQQVGFFTVILAEV
jgi:hypothetical protein